MWEYFIMQTAAVRVQKTAASLASPTAYNGISSSYRCYGALARLDPGDSIP